ncbi:hypothetical protein ACTXLB_20185 [Brachybacterium tyrofermentans]|uniref:hypothetical protein n=1 Tax=Brachybacterium tyrofermentans TaxID=47848 RepID=UPI003FD478A1
MTLAAMTALIVLITVGFNLVGAGFDLATRVVRFMHTVAEFVRWMLGEHDE